MHSEQFSEEEEVLYRGYPVIIVQILDTVAMVADMHPINGLYYRTKNYFLLKLTQLKKKKKT